LLGEPRLNAISRGIDGGFLVRRRRLHDGDDALELLTELDVNLRTA